MAHGHKSQACRLTWEDYRGYPDDERWEIIDGVAYNMSAAPATRHQKIVGRLNRYFEEFFEDRECEPYVSPTDVKLSDNDIVQPDLLVICKPNQDKESHIEGAPRLVIEVLSPTSVHHDRIRKLSLYARSGVREVWLITPFPSAVEIFVLDGARYRLEAVFEKQDELASPTFPELTIDLEAVFDFPVDPGEELHLIKEGRPGYPAGVS